MHALRFCTRTCHSRMPLHSRKHVTYPSKNYSHYLKTNVHRTSKPLMLIRRISTKTGESRHPSPTPKIKSTKHIKSFISLLFYTLASFSPLQADIVRRAAIDIGSAETKLTIADVDTAAHKIMQIYYQEYRSVELRKDLAASQDGSLSLQIENRLIETLNNYKTATVALMPKEWFGIGTAVFRKASNGQEILDRIKQATGISIHLATQAEEGQIGFQSAVATSGLAADQVIAWDSGSGSFQITTLNGEHIDMYGAEFALVPALEVLTTEIRGKTFNQENSPNPILFEEVDLLANIIQNEKLPPVPNWLTETQKTLVSFGGETSIFSMGQIATGKHKFTRDELWNAIKHVAGKPDEALSIFPEPHKTVVGLTLLYSVMNHCNINAMEYAKTNGGCEGLLIINNYWK